MKFDKGAGDHDNFEDAVIFWIPISDLPQSIAMQAKSADGEQYNPDCFGTCVVFDVETKKYRLEPDKPNTNVYYVKDNGDKLWFSADMSKRFVRELFTACKKELVSKGLHYKKNCSRDSR